MRSQAEKQAALKQAFENTAVAASQKKEALEDLAAEKLKKVQETLQEQGDSLIQKAKESQLYKKIFGGE